MSGIINRDNECTLQISPSLLNKSLSVRRVSRYITITQYWHHSAERKHKQERYNKSQVYRDILHNENRILLSFQNILVSMIINRMKMFSPVCRIFNFPPLSQTPSSILVQTAHMLWGFCLRLCLVTWSSSSFSLALSLLLEWVDMKVLPFTILVSSRSSRTLPSLDTARVMLATLFTPWSSPEILTTLDLRLSLRIKGNPF